MRLSAMYACPVRGLAGLQPPEPERLGQAARAAKTLGLDHLLIPVLEESFLGTVRAKVGFIDGLILALDQVAEARHGVRLVAPAQKVLGVDWVPPHLVSGGRDPHAKAVYVDGRFRHLRPFDWWADPSLVEKRVRIFRELASAVQGHPALQGWVVMDRAFMWFRPETHVAELFLRSLVGEIRDRDEKAHITMDVDWRELLDPHMVGRLTSRVDGIRLSGLDQPPGMEGPLHLSGEMLMAGFLGLLSQWVFARPTEVEFGWQSLGDGSDLDAFIEAGRAAARKGLAGALWFDLVDPDFGVSREPPWILRPGLERSGLLDRGLEPKRWVESWLKEVLSTEPEKNPYDFIDLSPEEYGDDPLLHLSRLWGHFRDAAGL